MLEQRAPRCHRQRQGIGIQPRQIELRHRAELVADVAGAAHQFALQLGQLITVAAGDLVERGLLAVAAGALQPPLRVFCLLACAGTIAARLLQRARRALFRIDRGCQHFFGSVDLLAVGVAAVFGAQRAIRSRARGLAGDLAVLRFDGFRGIDAQCDLFDLFLDQPESFQQRAELADISRALFGDQGAHEQVDVIHPLQIQRVLERLPIRGRVDLHVAGRPQLQQQIAQETVAGLVQLRLGASGLAAGDDCSAELRPRQRQLLAFDRFQMIVQGQRNAGQQVQAVHAVIGLVGGRAQRDSGGQRLAADGVLEDQTDVRRRGLAHAAVVAGAVHAQAVVADAAGAMAAAGLGVETDLVAVRAQHHDLQGIQQCTFTSAVGRDDRSGGVQFQGFGLEQEELHQMGALKLMHRQCP